MSFINKYNLAFCAICALSALAIFCAINGISISYKEALIFFNNETLIAKLANLSVNYFGRNDYALRAPVLFFHLLNLLMIYLISNRILKHRRDSILCVAIYAMLPGVMMQGALINESAIMLFVMLFVCYLEIIKSRFIYFALFVGIFVSSSAFMLFLALFFYSLWTKNLTNALIALGCFCANMYLFGIDISGKPSGRFLELISELSLLYSPPLFVYYVYTLYRNITKSQNLLLFVSVTSLSVSFLLSIRQGIDKEVFLFMSLCGIPLMIRQFLSDIRLRLPQFQRAYKNRFIIVLVFLIAESSLLVANKTLYAMVSDTQNLFLNSFYIARELSDELKKRNISRVSINDEKMRLRLKFYGIENGGQKLRNVKKNGNIVISYYDVIVARYAI